MAKSDPKSNGLRQDQPECAPAMRERMAGPCVDQTFGDAINRSDVTELPGLTSDLICAADRRGEILIPSDLIVGGERGINPSTSVRGPAERDRSACSHARAQRPREVGDPPEVASPTTAITLLHSGWWLLKPVERNAVRRLLTW